MSRPPRKGARLIDERKRKATAQGLSIKPPAKRRKGAGGGAASERHLIVEGEDDDEQSDLVLMYNTVRGYVSAVKELWSY